MDNKKSNNTKSYTDQMNNMETDIINTDSQNSIKPDNVKEVSKGNSRRLVALIGVVLLAIVIIALLLTAIFDPTGVWFRACLVLAIALPILLWIYVWLYGLLKQKKTMASFEFLEEDEKRE